MVRQRRLLSALLVMPLVLSACTQLDRFSFRLPEAVPAPTTTASTSKKIEVQVDGTGKLLDKGVLNTLSCADLVAQIEPLLSSGRTAAAHRLIARYPDLAQQLLSAATAKQANHPALHEIARVYDQQCGLQANAGWWAVLQEKRKHPEHYVAYEATREQFQKAMSNGEYTAAVALNLCQALPPAPAAVIEMDACQLLSKALLLCGETEQAMHSIDRALTLGRTLQPHQAVHALLLLSDAQRRIDQHDRANESWQEAVELAGSLLAQPLPIADPVLWERCSYYRPYPNPWPETVEQHVEQYLSRASTLMVEAKRPQERGDRGECLVWACIGCCHLNRDEPQAALLALKRAEAATKSVRQREQLQLAEAEAFARMDQSVAALALLVQLAGRPSAEVAGPALAFIGAIRLKDGSPQQALHILQQAFEKYPAINWPRRGEAEANLGLAYLMMGREEEGIRWLHSAQQRFAEAGDSAHLQQCLTNEISYWENVGKNREADRARERLDAQ